MGQRFAVGVPVNDLTRLSENIKKFLIIEVARNPFKSVVFAERLPPPKFLLADQSFQERFDRRCIVDVHLKRLSCLLLRMF